MVCNQAQAAVDNARRYTTCEPGKCLQYTRGWLEIPSRDATAAIAWSNALGRHGGDIHPPKGAPVFWLGGSQGYGHIGLAVNHKEQKFRGTDMDYAGQVSDNPVAWIEDHWGMPYAGWAEGFNGVWIPYLKDWDNQPQDPWSHGDVYVSKLHYKQQDSDSVARLRYRLDHHPNIPKKHHPGFGRAYGDEVVEAVRYWQRQVKPKVSGPDDGKSLSNPQANALFGPNYHVIEK